LFVATSSIGADPNWTGETDEQRRYWHDYSFGYRSETVSSKARKEMLEQLIPFTKIADKCSFEGNFL